MPKYIEGIGIINPGDENVLKRYIFKQRYKSHPDRWRLEGDTFGVPQNKASTYFWCDVLNDRVMRDVKTEWVAVGRIIYSVGTYPWE